MKKEHVDFINQVSSLLLDYHFSKEVADFIGCQFALESSFGRSSLALNHNNFCGMKTPMVRISVADNFSVSDSNNVFAHYSGLEWCICDYVLCIQYHRPKFDDFHNLQSFMHFIKGWYCPDKDYISSINRIYVQFKSN